MNPVTLFKRKAVVALPLSAMLFLTACGSSNTSDKNVGTPSSPQPDIAAEYQGVWHAPGYGISLEISENTVNFLQSTTNYCFAVDQFDDVNTTSLKRQLKLEADQQHILWFGGTGTTTFGAPGVSFEKRSELPASCMEERYSVDSEISGYATLFAMYSQIMDEYYLDFDRNNVDWQQLSYDLSITLDNTSTIGDFLGAVNYSFEILQDGHNTLATPDGDVLQVLARPTLLQRLVENYASENGLPFPIPDDQITQQLVAQINRYLTGQLEHLEAMVAGYATSTIHQSDNGQVTWFKINNVGYLNVSSMINYSTASSSADDLAQVTSALENINAIMDEVLTDLADTQGLILDIRNNGGGADYISLAIASRFAPADTHVYSKQARDGESKTPLVDVRVEPSDRVRYLNPVTLLTSHDTASAAETFTVSMAQFDQVSIVGEVTQGVLSDVLQWPLPGGFLLGHSNEFYYTPQGDWLEGTGIAPDVQVSFFEKSYWEAGIDKGIETAYKLLN